MLLKWPWRSLHTTIIAWSFVPTAIILVAVALLTFYAYQRVTEDSVVGRNREVTRFSAGQLSGDLRQFSDLLSAVARGGDIASGDPGTQRAALTRVSDRLVVFDGGTVILDEFGRVAAAEPARPEALGHDWSDRPYFRQLLRGGGPVFSDIVADGQYGTEVVVVAVPIFDSNGDSRGVIVGMFSLESRTVSALYGMIAKLRIGNSGTAYLVDSAGRVIYHTDALRIGEDASRLPVVQQVLGRKIGDLRTQDGNGRTLAASYAPVPGTSWGLVTEDDWATLLAPSQGYQQFLIVLLVLGIVLPAVVTTFGVQRIGRSLKDLTTAAQEVAGGNFNRKLTAPFGGELEDLVDQFNLMSSQLKDSYSTLERRVTDRTRDLAMLNAISAAVSASLDLEEVLHDALEKTLQATGMEAGAAYLLDEKTQTLSLLALRGLSEDFVAEASTLPLAEAMPSAVREKSLPAILEPSDTSRGNLAAHFQADGLQLAVCIPLVAKGKLLGTINLGSHHPCFMSTDERSLLASIGQQIGVAVENASLYERAEESAAAAERSRLARDLHDAVSQTLFSASLIADVLPRLWERNPEEGRRRLEELRVLTRGALAEMRTLLLELRPTALQEAPLTDLLRQLGEATTGRARLPVSLKVSGECSVPSDVKIALYRIAQEALNNVAKHAGASNAAVELTCLQDRVQLLIRDDGRGFDRSLVPANHLGLGIMEERALAIGADLTVDSNPGEGTEVSVVWVCPAEHPAAAPIAAAEPEPTADEGMGSPSHGR